MTTLSPYRFVMFEKREHVALVSFNRPEVMNAIHPEMDRSNEAGRAFLQKRPPRWQGR